ncbi:MAG: hypothetical protein ABFD92_05970 [Planctomycetaceae bacterium]|nr:hypothetical protein [Planctomycetaceae bacterium]
MASRKGLTILALGAVVALGFVAEVMSQDSRPADEGQARMERFRQQLTDRLKQSLGVANDEEWKALQPRLEKVTALRAQSMGFGGRTRGNRRGGDNNNNARNAEPQNDVAKASADLQKVLQNADAKPQEIKTALDALRAARAKARDDLAKAQKELQEVLTLRQEAQLVSMGMLE